MAKCLFCKTDHCITEAELHPSGTSIAAVTAVSRELAARSSRDHHRIPRNLVHTVARLRDFEPESLTAGTPRGITRL